MAAPILLTMRDLIDQAADFCGGTNQAVTQRDIRSAIQNAYIELADKRKWRYFQKHYRVVTNAIQTTGTVQYTASTNQLVLSGSTWPTWATSGVVVINQVISTIVSVSNDGVTATLDNVLCPDGDIAAGSGYILMQDEYPLPQDFRTAGMPVNEGYLRYMTYVPPDNFMAMERIRYATGKPTQWTIKQDQRYMGTYSIAFFPAPDTSFSIDFTYYGRPRQMRITGYGVSDTGTANGTAGSNIITAATGTFKSTMVGSMIRFRQDAITPDGSFGLNQFDEQRVVAGYADSTHIILDANLENTYAGGAYVVSDPVDYPPHLTTVLVRAVQKQLAIQRQMKGMAQIAAAYDDSLLQAQDADEVVSQRRSCYDIQPGVARRLARMPLGPDIG